MPFLSGAERNLQAQPQDLCLVPRVPFWEHHPEIGVLRLLARTFHRRRNRANGNRDLGGEVTDAEIRDAAVVELKKTTQGFLKSNGQPRPLVGAQWKKGLDLLAQIGQANPLPSAFDIPHFAVTLEPGGTGWAAGWRKFSTPANSLDPGGNASFGTPANPRAETRKSWEWWLCTSILVPSSHPDVSNNITTVDTHNHPHDVGGVGTAGIGWGWGDLVSAQEFIYNAPSRTMRNMHESNFPNHLTELAAGMTGERYDFVVQMILGRLDKELGLAGPGVPGGGIGDHPNDGFGRTRIWVNGSNTPADSGNINNLQRARNPNDGKTYTQTMFYRTWDGWYTGVLAQRVTAELYATRMGTTLAEALVDGSSGFELQSELLVPGRSSIQSLAPLSSVDFRVPSSLRE